MAIQYLRTAAVWASRLRELDLEMVTAGKFGIALYDVGLFTEAHNVLKLALQKIEEHGAVFYTLQVADPFASLLLEMDQSDEARHWLEVSKSYASERAISAIRVNSALLEFHCRDYPQCLEKCAEFLNSQSAGFWHEIPVRGVRGLALMELGRLAEAREDAKRIVVLLESLGGAYGDVSYGLLLLSRLAGLGEDQPAALRLATQSLAAYENRDIVCRQRLRLAWAEALPLEESELALRTCEAVIALAEEKSLPPLSNIAQSTRARIARRRNKPARRSGQVIS